MNVKKNSSNQRWTVLPTLALGSALLFGFALARGETPDEKARPKDLAMRPDVGAFAARMLRREYVYDIASGAMCGLGFSNDEDFDWFGGPATITQQCESNVNPVCSNGYLPLGVLEAQLDTISYRCSKSKGGPAATNPTCEPRFAAADASGSEYACTAKVERRCFQSHWQPTGLSAEGYRVTYQCWGQSM